MQRDKPPRRSAHELYSVHFVGTTSLMTRARRVSFTPCPIASAQTNVHIPVQPSVKSKTVSLVVFSSYFYNAISSKSRHRSKANRAATGNKLPSQSCRCSVAAAAVRCLRCACAPCGQTSAALSSIPVSAFITIAAGNRNKANSRASLSLYLRAHHCNNTGRRAAFFIKHGLFA